nr:lysoplasmalogenase [Rhabdothermincola salaria]
MAVGTGRRAAEYALKPLVMVGLVVTALTLDASDDAVRVAVVVALVLSLAGDVFLMLPRDLFVPGLASFLAAHVAYIVAMVLLGASGAGLPFGLVAVGLAVAVVGGRVLRGAKAADPALVGPVALYLAVISIMVATAAGTGLWLVVLGAVSFYVSDAVLGWTRFVSSFRHSRVVVMVTYHLGQALLVVGLM